MDTTMNIKRDSSNVWPYVIAGSAIGGAVGYLFMTESGRKIRHAVTHPNELADNLEEARTFVENKSRIVADRIHNALQKARHSIEEGQRAYDESDQRYKSRVHEVQGKTVDTLNRTAVTIEQDVMHRICELGALYRAIERGLQTLRSEERETVRETERFAA
jgi:gas vesicle protein